MAQSLSKILVHLIFSTKCREPFLKDQQIRRDLEAYMAGTLRQCESIIAFVKCVPDHVHVFCSLSKNIAAAELVEEVKTSSSKWLKTKGA